LIYKDFCFLTKLELCLFLKGFSIFYLMFQYSTLPVRYHEGSSRKVWFGTGCGGSATWKVDNGRITVEVSPEKTL
jgi:hypothetical protein